MTAPAIQGMSIPAGWVALQLKHACVVRDCKHVTAEFVDDGFPVASIREVQSRYVDLTVAKRTTTSYYLQLIEGERRPRAGDLLISRNATVGEVAQVPSDSPPFAMGQDVCLLRPTPHRLNSAFAWYVLLSGLVQSQIALAMIGSTFKRVNVEQIRNLSIVLPPLQQQLEIVDFLDHETAKIDALIVKQEQLIATLREDRTATITHAITKGLHPDAEMIDSGMQWFGHVPSHWVIRPLGTAAKLIQTGPFGSQLHATDYVDNGVPIINPSHVSDGRIQPNEHHTVTLDKATELARHRFRDGDVVAARRGDLGRCAVITPNSVGYICGTGSVLIRADIDQVTPEYLQLAFGSHGNRQRLLQISEGSTMDNLNADMVARLRMPLPPVAEQLEIVEFIKRRSNTIDALIAKANGMTNTLREYRSALITDAVTGKVDVRGAA